jgi:hypothetical protein
MKKLDNLGVKWVMTQTNNKLIRDTFKNYTIKSFTVYRGFSGKTTEELIIMNY